MAALVMGLACAGSMAAPADLPDVDLSSLPAGIRSEIEAARRRVAGSPDDASANGELGMLYLVYDLPGAAVTCFERSVRSRPAEHRWIYYLGMARQSAGDAPGAIQALTKAQELRPDDVATLVRLGNLLVESDPQRASALFRRALALSPDNARAHAGLGHAARAAGRPDEAMASYEAALRVAPSYAEAHYALAMLLAARGDRDAAREHLRAHATGEEPSLLDDPLALELARKGRNAAALRREAAALARKGDAAGAIALLTTALSYDVSGTTTRQHLGLLLAQQGRFDEAAGHLSQVVAADPGNVEARSMLGLALTELGRLGEAEAQYAEALRRHSDHAPTLIYMAQLMARTSRPAEAITHARRGVEAQPANVTYRSMLVELLARAGRGAEAIEEARRLVELSPAGALRMAEPHAGQAAAALARGDAPEAVREAETACTLGAYKVLRHVELLASAYEAAGRAQDAQRAREQAERLPAETPR
ncbi:MAG: tetratricopeptide repeat protein [Candidatus Polarisedimenticolia bacterium]